MMGRLIEGGQKMSNQPKKGFRFGGMKSKGPYFWATNLETGVTQIYKDFESPQEEYEFCKKYGYLTVDDLRDDASRALSFVTSVVLSATISGFVFAAIHPQGWVAVPALMGLAYAFAVIREWRGTSKVSPRSKPRVRYSIRLSLPPTRKFTKSRNVPRYSNWRK